MSVHDVSNAIDGVDVVLHLSRQRCQRTQMNDPIYDVQSNLVSTLQLLNAMVAKQVRKMCYFIWGYRLWQSGVSTNR